MDSTNIHIKKKQLKQTKHCNSLLSLNTGIFCNPAQNRNQTLVQIPSRKIRGGRADAGR